MNMSKELSEELQIVVLCSKSQLYPGDLTRVEELLQGESDWSLIIDLANKHKVLPRVWENLNAQFFELIPENISALQKAAGRSHFLTCALMVKHLLEVLVLFEQKSIFSIPYKGPVAALYLYGDISLRSYGDLDLLISRDDFPRVFQVMLENGYAPEIDIPSKQLVLYSSVEDNLSFRSPRGLLFEIHWELSGRYLRKPMDMDFVCRDLGSVKLANREVPIFSDENQFIYFCLHGTKHCWEQLDLVSCVAELLGKAKNIDWRYVFGTATEYRCKRMLFVGILLAEKLFSTAVPYGVRRGIILDESSVALSEEIYNKVYAASAENSKVTDPRFSLLRMNIRDSRIDLVLYILRLVFIPSKAEWQAVLFPSVIRWMYYIIRPFRVAGAVLSRAFKKGIAIFI